MLVVTRLESKLPTNRSEVSYIEMFKKEMVLHVQKSQGIHLTQGKAIFVD